MTAAQSQKHVTFNEAILKLDAFSQSSIIDRDLTAPPGSESDGDLYIVGASATGSWSSQDGNLALYVNGDYVFITPVEGMAFWVDDEDIFIIYNGASWSEITGGGGSATLTENAQTGTSYTLVIADAPDVVVSLENAGAITLTVPPNSSVAFDVGTQIIIWQKGSGQVTISEGSGVTVEYPASATLKLREQGSWVSLVKTDTDTWSLFGDLEGAPGGTLAADDVSYDNGTSGLTATDIQAAIDEIVAGLLVVETGTFTPTVEGSTTPGSASYTAQVGRYSKIDLTVRFDSYVNYTGHTGVGNLVITGYPFTSAVGPALGVVQVLPVNLTFSNQLAAEVHNSTTQVRLYSYSSNATPAQVAMDAAAGIYVSGTYQASA